VIGCRDTAVVLTAWRRPGYLKRALESWAQVRYVKMLREFTVYVDPSDRQDEILGVCRDAQPMLPVMRVIVNPERYGVLRNPEQSMIRAFADPDVKFAVVADDDMLVSTDVLSYFTWSASEFEADEKVAAVCAHTPEPAHAQASEEEVHLLPRYRCWIWGTWRDRWENVIGPTWDGDYSSGEPSGYDWNLDLRVIPGQKLTCVFPAASRSQNIGRFEGVHASPAEFAGTANPSFRAERNPLGYRLVSE
jgi:glycosyl transferase family 2